MHGVRRPGSSTLLGFILVAVLAAGVPAAYAENHDVCVTARVPETFTLPDGTVHAAGRITLCTVLSMSPATGVHRIWLDGEGASIVLSHRSIAEASPETAPTLLFKRDLGGVLDFVGFVVPEGRKAWTYSLRRGVGKFGAPSAALVVAH